MTGSALVLTGSRCVLRPLTDADVTPAYVAWLNDPEVTRYMETGREPSSEASVRAYLERFRQSTRDFIFAIIDQETQLHIGNVTLNRWHPVHGTADTGLMIGRKEFWGRGYATDAWRLLLEFAFDRLGVRKMVAGAVADNTGSVKALQSLGFRVEGVLRQELMADGAFRDCLRFGLLRDEFIEARQAAAGSPGASTMGPTS